jgi:outer membrane murein-binding lipoprotein Lpp
MKKVTGIVLALVMAGVVLSGCYSKSCDQPAPQPMSYKGETR